MKKFKLYLIFILASLFAVENFAGDLKFKGIKPITKNTNYAMTSMSYNVTVENVGTAVGSYKIYGYISKTKNINDGLIVYNKTISSMPQNSNFTDVFILDIPCNQRAGDYFLLIKIDADNQIAETNETNNTYIETFKLLPTLKVDQLNYKLDGASQRINVLVESDSTVTMTKSASWIQFPNGLNSQTFNSCPAVIMDVSTYISSRSAEIIVKRGNITKKIIVYQNGTLASCFSSVTNLSHSSTSNSITVSFSNLNQTMKIEYRPHWSSEWKSVNVNSSPYVVSNLAQGTKYLFRISAKCSNISNFGTPVYFSANTLISHSQHKAFIYVEPHVSLTRDINTWYLGTSNAPISPNTVVSPDVFFTYKVVDSPGYMEINTIQGEVYDAVMSIYEYNGGGLTLIKTIDDNLFGGKMPSVKLAAPEYKANATYVIRIYSKGQPGGFQVKQTAVSFIETGASTRSEISESLPEKNIAIDYCTSPVESNLNIKLSSTYEDQTVMQIFDLNGALIKQEFVEITKGENKLSIDCMNIPSGLYIIKVADKSKKFVKL